MSDQAEDEEEYKLKQKEDKDYREYKRIYGLLRKEYQIGFRVAVINTNTNAFNDKTMTALDEFIPWDALEDVMPFLTWDETTYGLITTLTGHTRAVRSVAFSTDGPPRIVSGSTDKTIKVWDGTTYGLLTTLRGHADCVWSVAFSTHGPHGPHGPLSGPFL